MCHVALELRLLAWRKTRKRPIGSPYLLFTHFGRRDLLYSVAARSASLLGT